MNQKHALAEFLADYHHRDLIKARVVMDYLHDLEHEERRRILFELLKCDDDFAFPLLAYLAEVQPHIVASTPQLKESLLEKAQHNPQMLLDGVETNRPERRQYIVLIGEVGLTSAVPQLTQLLATNPERSILMSILTTLGRLKVKGLEDEIASYLDSDDWELQQAALDALGWIGTPRALNRLYSVLGPRRELNQQVLDIFQVSSEEVALELLNQCLLADQAVLRSEAKTRLGLLGERALPMLIRNLQLITDADLVIHSLNVLQEIGHIDAVQPIRRLLNSEPEDANVRFAAYEALSQLPALKGDYMTAVGLMDVDDGIRLAAAKAINNNLTPRLITGVRNLVKGNRVEGARVIMAVLDAQAGDLFGQLAGDPFVDNIAVPYLSQQAHPDVRAYFLSTLANKGQEDLVQRIKAAELVNSGEKPRLQVCAVDDSTMVLSIYRRVLRDLGYDPILFQSGVACLAWLTNHSPGVVFTDLNMPEITGLELASRIRALPGQAHLPIIMVTTQKQGRNDERFKNAGVSRVISKPFDGESLKAVLAELSIDATSISQVPPGRENR